MGGSRIPKNLIEKIKVSGHWQGGWQRDSHGRDFLATSFRLRNGRRVDLIVSREGAIWYLLNPFTYSGCEPVPPEAANFDFDPADITALCGMRVVRSRLLPWVRRREYFDLVHLD